MSVTELEMIYVWGEEFFNECLKEATAVRKLHFPKDWEKVPVDLILAVAVKKLRDKK